VRCARGSGASGKLAELDPFHLALDPSGTVALRWLYGLRLKADYTEEPVELDDAKLAYEKAERLLESLVR
jgi:hypothetical protein